MSNVTKHVSAGSKITLVVISDGAAPLTYEWFRDGAKIAEGQNFTIQAASELDEGTYSARAANVHGQADSLNSVTLSVDAPPVITIPLSNRTVPKQSRLEWSIAATGEQPLSYRWQKGSSLVPGANSATLIIPKINPSHAGTYVVKVTTPSGEEASSKAVLTVR